MCSILGILDIQTDSRSLRDLALRLSKRQRHRGPDWSGIHSGERAILAHERLAIVGVDSGAQPLYNPQRTHVLAVNGEIYNHQRLERELKEPFELQTDSDCEVILALYAQRGADFLDCPQHGLSWRQDAHREVTRNVLDVRDGIIDQ